MSLQSLAQQHKAALIRRDVALADQLAMQYQLAWNRIQARLTWLLSQMQQAQDSGQAVNPSWLYEQQRLQGMLHEVSSQITVFSQQANRQVQAQANMAQHQGAQDATLLLRHALGSVKSSFNQPQPQAVQILANRGASNVKIAELFAKMDTQTKTIVRRWLLLGVSLGKGPREIARDIQHALSKPLSSALTIARTEAMNAYRTGTLSIYRANSDVVTSWTWLASPGACPFCESMNGTHHGLSESMDSHPNCRCTCLPDTLSYEQILQGVA